MGCLEFYHYFFPPYMRLFMSKESLQVLFHQYLDIRFYQYFSPLTYMLKNEKNLYHYDNKQIMTKRMAIVINRSSISVS